MIQSGMVRFHEDLEPLLMDIDAVSQHPQNYNNGDTEALAESVMVNGMYRPIYVQRSTGYIIAGNHTWVACKELGATKIPVVTLDVDDTSAKKIMIADNRIAQLARPDDSALLRLLDDLAANDTITGTGFADHDVETLRLLQDQIIKMPMGGGFIPDALANFHTCPECGHEFRTGAE